MRRAHAIAHERLGRTRRRRTSGALVLASALVLVAGCSSSDAGSGAAPSSPTGSSPAASDAPSTDAGAASGSAPPTTFDIVTVPPGSAPATQDPAATGTILMVKLFVGDIPAGEAFYGSVFGATSVAAIGPTAQVLTMQDGPGLILLQKGPDDGDNYGAFIMKVPDLEAAKARALANGATEQGTFAGAPAGQSARSVDLLDPWGNQIEILQLG